MTEVEPRIVMWRRAVSLFLWSRRFDAPFGDAGIDRYLIEQKIVGMTDSKPDVIVWRVGEDGDGDLPVVLELTMNDPGRRRRSSTGTGISRRSS